MNEALLKLSYKYRVNRALKTPKLLTSTCNLVHIRRSVACVNCNKLGKYFTTSHTNIKLKMYSDIERGRSISSLRDLEDTPSRRNSWYSPKEIPKRTLYRLGFALCGVNNICWGVYTAINPQWFFQYAGMDYVNYPHTFAAIGMFIALHGILYLEIARVPEKGWLLGAIGLFPKIFGPLGILTFIFTAGWPWRSILPSFPNDILLYPLFLMYLRDAWPFFSRELQKDHPAFFAKHSKFLKYYGVAFLTISAICFIGSAALLLVQEPTNQPD